MEFVIQTAKPEDAEFIARAQIAMAKETEGMELVPEVVRRGVGAMMQKSERGQYYVARSESGEPVACLLVQFEWSDWRDADVWWIHSIYVMPLARKQGAFRALYDEIRGRAKECGAKGIRLYMDKSNARAREAYLRMGMTADHYEVYEDMFVE